MIHTSIVKGDKNEKKSLYLLIYGRRYRMLIPKFKNGSEKSTTCSRCDVIVRAATAKSAFYKRKLS